VKRTQLAALSLLLVLILTVSGCGSPNNGKPVSADSIDKPSSLASNRDGSDKSGEKITLTLMHLWPEDTSAQHKVVSRIIDEYQKANPNVKIQTDMLANEQYKSKLKILAASNELPDIAFTWAAGFMTPYVKNRMFAPLNDIVQGEFKGKFVAGTVEAYSVNGNDYALPVELNTVPIFYNKSIFQKYNLQPPKTYDELLNIIRTLRGNGVTPITLGGKDGWPASLWYMYLADRIGGPYLMDQSVANRTFTDPALIAAAKKSQELVDMDAFNQDFIGLSNDEATAVFMKSQAAMYMTGTWEVPNYTMNKDFPQEFRDQIGFFKFPTIDGGKGNVDDWVGGPGVGLFVSQNSKHLDEAKRFVTFFAKKWGEISVTDAGIIPATKVNTDAIKLPQMYIDLLNELNNAKKVTLYLDVQMNPTEAKGHYNLIQELFSKHITPEEFALNQENLLKDGN
jgi:raffinose/stachyose/melibiose transport system substrate-binding protein